MDFSSFFEMPPLQNDNFCVKGSVTRVTVKGDPIDCYRNLNKDGLFSIRQRQGPFKGLVCGHARAIVLTDPVLVVGEKSRQRVLSEQTRNVHAFVRGRFEAAFGCDLTASAMRKLIRVSYSPFLSGQFFALERDASGDVILSSVKPLDPDTTYTYAVLNGRDVFLKAG